MRNVGRRLALAILVLTALALALPVAGAEKPSDADARGPPAEAHAQAVASRAAPSAPQDAVGAERRADARPADSPRALPENANERAARDARPDAAQDANERGAPPHVERTRAPPPSVADRRDDARASAPAHAAAQDASPAERRASPPSHAGGRGAPTSAGHESSADAGPREGAAARGPPPHASAAPRGATVEPRPDARAPAPPAARVSAPAAVAAVAFPVAVAPTPHAVAPAAPTPPAAPATVTLPAAPAPAPTPTPEPAPAPSATPARNGGGRWRRFLDAIRHAGAALVLGFRRVTSRNALAHDLRARVLDTLRERPGTPIRRLAAELDTTPQALHYHVRILERAGLVATRGDGAARAYFPVAGGRDAGSAASAATALRAPAARDVLVFVAARPGAHQAAIARAVGIKDGSASWHARRLRDAGLLLEVREGRRLSYVATSIGERLAGAGRVPQNWTDAATV